MSLKQIALLALIGVTGAVAAPVAIAQAKPDQGFYIGGHFGQTDIKELDETDTGWKIVGGYQINRNFAVEAGYIDFGDVTLSNGVTSLTLKATAFELVGVGTLPVADRFSVYGKVGLYRGEAEANFVNVPGFGTGSESDSSIELTYGFGLRFDITRNLSLRGEWQRYGDVGDGATDIDVLSLGVIFKF